LSDKDIQVRLCSIYAYDILSMMDEEMLKENLDILTHYISKRFVDTHPLVSDGMTDQLLIIHFDEYLVKNLDTILEFIKSINSSILLFRGDA
jgi:hypothetical protein